MITNVRFENFRSHGDTQFPLHPITLLIGSVAAGKSNVFKGLQFLRNSIHRSLVELFSPGFGEFRYVRSRWAEQTDPIGFEIELDGLGDDHGETATYKLRIADSPHGLYVLEESLQRKLTDGAVRWVFQRGDRPRVMGEFGEVDPYEPTLLNRVFMETERIDRDSPNVKFATRVGHFLLSFGYYHLAVPELKAFGTGQALKRINYDGSGLPDFVAWAKSSDEGRPFYEKILAGMKELLPELDEIPIRQYHGEKQGLGMSFHWDRSYIEAEDWSDGTLLTLGLLCLVHSPNRPRLLCIEEPEAGLNPRRLRWLFDRLIELAYPTDGNKPTQVILSTHSPWLIDLFGKDLQDSVLLVEQKAGRTRVTPLVEIERDKFHQELMPGEPLGHIWATGVYEGL